MEFSIANIITLALAIGTALIGYGSLHQKVKDICEHRKVCERRFEAIESDHDSNIKGIREEIKSISALLNQLIGKIDIYMKIKERQ